MVLLQYALLLPLRHAEDTVGGIQLVLIGSPYGTPCCVPHWQEGVTLTALSGIFVLSAVLLLSFPAGCSLRFEVLVQIQEANTGLSPHLPGAHCHCPLFLASSLQQLLEQELLGLAEWHPAYVVFAVLTLSLSARSLSFRFWLLHPSWAQEW